MGAPDRKASVAGDDQGWRVSYWMCGGDVATCCSVFWCPCLVYASNKREVEGDDRYWRSAAAFYCLPLALKCLLTATLGMIAPASLPALAASGTLHAVPWMAKAAIWMAGNGAMMALGAPLRARLREQEGLAQGPCSDPLAWVLCPKLALCQEAGHLKRGRAERAAAGLVALGELTPPEEQSMLSSKPDSPLLPKV